MSAALSALLFPAASFAAGNLVYLEHSETLSFDEELHPGCQILTGNVKFRMDSSYMYCDTAYFFNKRNVINAAGNIRMEQGDTLFVYGDKLYYDGDKRMARLRHNVRMENRGATLYTDSLNYDRRRGVGYYFVWGRIIDSTNVLSSVNGTYYTESSTAVFQHDVKLSNEDYVLYSDTLRYNTDSKIAYILGPSTIVYDSTTVYSEDGWYDTERDFAKLLKNNVITDSKGRALSALTMDYDHANGKADGVGSVQMKDTSQSVMVRGGYGFYDEKLKRGHMVKLATFIDFSSEDSLFLTADTLFFDSKDSTMVWGNYNVQSFQKDFQTICDSMFYDSRDSIMRLYGTPVCWNSRNQITGDSIYMYSRNQTIEMIDVLGNAFMFMQADSTAYNQISGKTIRGYVADGRLTKLHVEGNAMSVYFVEEEDSARREFQARRDYVGINRAESSELIIFVGKDNRPERITMIPASSGTMYTPDKQDKTEISRLASFIDCAPLRPSNKFDIYLPKDRSKLKAAAESKPRFKRKER